MYSIVSIGPSHSESPTGFSQAHPPQTMSHYRNFSLLPKHFFFIRTLKTIEKQIHTLPSQETILVRTTGDLPS